jgi:Cu-Zn family superoxide dismutase
MPPPFNRGALSSHGLASLSLELKAMKTPITILAAFGTLLLLDVNGTFAAASAPVATATLSPASGSNVRGTVKFLQEKDGIRVEAEITGLSPGKHGFHIHEKGDCSAPDASSAGGHFNPTGMPHAGPTEHHRHVGDFGNLEADESGNAKYSRSFSDLKIAGETSILGKAVIVHAKADDLKTQPSGDAGGRVACGVIEKK